MKYFFNFSEYFLSAISEIGDFLLYKPFTTEFFNRYDFLISGKTKLALMHDVDAFADISIGSMLFGSALVGVLLFKLIKFVLDIIT